MYVDVHCHLELIGELGAVVEESFKKRVEKIVTSGTDVKTNRMSLAFAEEFPGIECVLGLYPIEALEMSDEEIDEEIEFIRSQKDKIIGIGEIGMDFNQNPGKEERKRQEEIFRKFISLAMELEKPMVVHSRKAEEECIDVLQDMAAKKVVMHCFCGSEEQVKRIEKNGWYLSIPSSINYMENFSKIVKEVDLKQMLCETDSPYMHPESRKRRDNNPGNVVSSYEKIAEIKSQDIKEVEEQVEKNFNELFG